MSSDRLFISHTGNDTTGDGSESNPFRTGNRALVPPGAGGPEYDSATTLSFKRGGTYPHFSLNRGGLDPLHIFQIQAYGDGPPPIVASANVQRGEPISYVGIQDLEFKHGDGSMSIGLEWRASGSYSSIHDCLIHGYEVGFTAQSTDDSTPNIYAHLNLVGLTINECAGIGAYFQGQKDLFILRPRITNIGSSQFHQGLYFNADNTSYSVWNGYFDNIANCAIQARAGLMDIRNNTIANSGYGIAVGHGMSRRAGRGSITKNVITRGKDRPDGGPLTCGIGVCMVDHERGNPFLIQGNVVHTGFGQGKLGAISLGNDLAIPYTNSDGVLSPEMGNVLVEGNWVQDWNLALRLVENHHIRMGITANTFLGTQETLRLVNSNGWKARGVRQFADYLSVSNIMQQNAWLPNPIVLEEGGMGGVLQFPEQWRGGFDPGFSLIPPADIPNLGSIPLGDPNYNVKCRALVGLE